MQLFILQQIVYTITVRVSHVQSSLQGRVLENVLATVEDCTYCINKYILGIPDDHHETRGCTNYITLIRVQSNEHLLSNSGQRGGEQFFMSLLQHEWRQGESFLFQARLEFLNEHLTTGLGGLENALLSLGAFRSARPGDQLFAFPLLVHQRVDRVDENSVVSKSSDSFLDALFLFLGLAALRRDLMVLFATTALSFAALSFAAAAFAAAAFAGCVAFAALRFRSTSRGCVFLTVRTTMTTSTMMSAFATTRRRRRVAFSEFAR